MYVFSKNKTKLPSGCRMAGLGYMQMGQLFFDDVVTEKVGESSFGPPIQLKRWFRVLKAATA